MFSLDQRMFSPTLRDYIGTVSYTHLDVYKRQVLNRMFADESLDGIRVYFPDPWPKACLLYTSRCV